MNKKLMMVFVGMVFLAVGFVNAGAGERVFSVGVEYHSGNVSIGNVFVTEMTYFEKNYSGEYELKVFDINAEELYSRNFDFVLEFVSGPPIEGEEDIGEEIFYVDDAEEFLVFPYFGNAIVMVVYLGGEKVAEKDILYLAEDLVEGDVEDGDVEQGDTGGGFSDWKFFVLFAVIVAVIIVAWWLVRHVVKDGFNSKLG